MLDLHELDRRPGSQRKVSRTVPAPVDLGIDVVGVPAGAPVDLSLRLEAVMEGVLVSGSARATLAGECVRCLDPLGDDIVVPLQELFVYPERVTAHAKAAAGLDADEERVVQDDLVDLEPVLRDALVLALPLAPLCRPDCPGLCAQCGARLADEPAHAHRRTDPRWAGLSGLLAEAPDPG